MAKLPTVSISSPTQLVQKATSLSVVNSAIVGGSVAVLKSTGALKNPDVNEVVTASSTKILGDLGVSGASTVIAAATGSKSAKEELGLQVAGSVLNNSVSTDTLRRGVAAANGDRNAQKQLALGAINSIVDTSALKNKAIDTILPQGSPFRSTVFDAYTAFKSPHKKSSQPASTIVNANARLSQNSRLLMARQRKDPLYSFDWVVELPDLPGVNLTVNKSTFNFYAEETSLALPFFSPQATFRNGTQTYYPGFSDVGTISIVFYEDKDMNTSRYLDYWHSLIQDADGNYALPNTYKKEFYVSCFDCKGNRVGVFTIQGAWPAQRGNYGLQSSSTERVTVNCEFSIDGLLFQRDAAVIPEEPASSLVQTPTTANKITSAINLANALTQKTLNKTFIPT